MAYIAMALQMRPLNPLLVLVGYFGLLFATQKARNHGAGLVLIFAFTSFMGYTLGPILNLYIHQFHNGSQLVMIALGSTGAIFLGLSGYALTTSKNFNFLGSFLMIGLIVGLLASLVGLFFPIPTLMMVVSALFILLSSGIILYQTSAIIHGGETNYIMATITLYVSIYNLFLNLLSLLGLLSGSRD
jgi:modulator of FtsH protease